MPFIEICTGTALIRVVSVHGHVATVLVIHAVSLICGPYKLLDTVSLTNINEQVDERGVGLRIDRVRLFGVAGDSIVIARLSFAAFEEHHERSFSSTYIPIRPSYPIP